MTAQVGLGSTCIAWLLKPKAFMRVYRHKALAAPARSAFGTAPVVFNLSFAQYPAAAAQVKINGGSAEYSLADCLSPASQGTSSPHSSPPVSRGSAEDAEVHPSKAYIPDPQVPL
jgi:hypothetical protein